jgi:hypothetical protein
MLRVMVVETVIEPDVPVTVSTDDPTAAALLAVNKICEYPVLGLGEIVAVTPAGRPDNDSATFPLKPYWPVT